MREPRCEYCGGPSTLNNGLSDFKTLADDVKLHLPCAGPFMFHQNVGARLTLVRRNPNDERRLGVE